MECYNALDFTERKPDLREKKTKETDKSRYRGTPAAEQSGECEASKG